MTTDLNRLPAALDLARRGFRVFPLHSVQDGRCTCGSPDCNGSSGKHPRDKGWQRLATTDPSAIGRLWARCPSANIGIACGRESGCFVLDIDPRHGGDQALARLEAGHGHLPATVTVITGGGGEHRYFAYPPDRKIDNARIGPGLEIKSDGGLVVGPGSNHLSGDLYQWALDAHPDQTPISPAPAWLLRLLVEGAQPPGAPAAGAHVVGSSIPKGQRDTMLTSFAGTMRRRGATESEIHAALDAMNRERCDPPLMGADIRRISHSVANYAPNDPIVRRLAQIDVIVEDEPAEAPAEQMGGAAKAGSMEVMTLTEVGEFYGSVDEAWAGRLVKGHLNMIVGEQGVGKSGLMARLAATFTGDLADWPDGQPYTGPTGQVLLLDTEEFRGAYAQRMRAMGVRTDKVILPKLNDDLTYLPQLDRDFQRIEQLAKAHECVAVLLDSLSGGHARDENSAEMRLLLLKLAQLGGSLQVPVIIAHHARKANQFEADKLTLDRIRGSSTISQFCRSIIGLRRVSKDDLAAPVRVESIKYSFGPPPDPLGFVITDHGLEFCEAPEEPKTLKPIDRAKELLRMHLRHGPRKSRELVALAEREGISEATLYRAKAELRLVVQNGVWALPVFSSILSHKN